MKKLLNPSVILGAATVLFIALFLATAVYTVVHMIVHPSVLN